MGTKTDVQWVNRVLSNDQVIAGHTFNAWWGCLKVSEECVRCYAEGIAAHYGHKVWGPAANTERRFFGDKHWQEPLKWNRQAQAEGHRHSVFCASMADVYEDHPAVVHDRRRLWELIEATPWLNWLLLTKRPENILRMSPWRREWPDNVWIGTSVGLQKRAEERIPLLLEVPAVVRFLSCEPLIGPVDLSPWISQLQWVITGGESGDGARVMNPEWAQAIRDVSLKALVPFYFKQVGGRYHNSGGSLLDGREWRNMPPERPKSLADRQIEAALAPWMDANDVEEIVNHIYSLNYTQEGGDLPLYTIDGTLADETTVVAIKHTAIYYGVPAFGHTGCADGIQGQPVTRAEGDIEMKYCVSCENPLIPGEAYEQPDHGSDQ